MGSKAILLIGFFLAMVLLISSEVAAINIDPLTEKTDGAAVNDQYRGGGREGVYPECCGRKGKGYPGRGGGGGGGGYLGHGGVGGGGGGHPGHGGGGGGGGHPGHGGGGGGGYPGHGGGGGGEGYPGHGGGGGGGGGYPGHGGGGGGGGGGGYPGHGVGGGGCRYGCCGQSYDGSGCRCCSYAGEKVDAQP